MQPLHSWGRRRILNWTFEYDWAGKFCDLENIHGACENTHRQQRICIVTNAVARFHRVAVEVALGNKQIISCWICCVASELTLQERRPRGDNLFHGPFSFVCLLSGIIIFFFFFMLYILLKHQAITTNMLPLPSAKLNLINELLQML